jgi:hypothetical protein
VCGNKNTTYKYKRKTRLNLHFQQSCLGIQLCKKHLYFSERKIITNTPLYILLHINKEAV